MSSLSAQHERDERDRQQQLLLQSSHLDLVFCSSEDESAPAQNLQTKSSHQHEQQPITLEYQLPEVLHGGWESEKFCEYPQELVFRVNRGIPTRVDHLHILSHHCKIASRVEVFTSSSTKTHPNELVPEFQRLGFVSFQSNEATDFASRELKIVHLQAPHNRSQVNKITLIRLVLHRCHENRRNLFQQVGLLSVVAFTEHHDLNSSSQSRSSLRGGVLPSLQPSRTEDETSSGHLFSASLSPLRAKYATNVSPERRLPAKPFISVSAPIIQQPHHDENRSESRNGGSEDYEVWIPELREFQTPLQIATRVRLCRELAALVSTSASETVATLWRSMDLESHHLLNKLAVLQRTYDNTQHLMGVDDRIAMHEEIDLVVHDFGVLGSKAFALELGQLTRHKTIEDTRTQSQHQKELQASLFQVFPNLKPKNLETLSWQTREDLVWKLIAYLQEKTTSGAGRILPSPQEEEEEAMGIVKHVLRDDHSQVFIAACSLFQLLLTTADEVQEPATLKNHLTEILDILMQRLDDRQAVVRNNAAFSILKIAELTRVKGAFVMHFTLKQLEDSHHNKQQHRLKVSDQVLHAVLKLFSALLLSFHCCASIDIAPRRVLKLLLRSDAAMHANPHIRDAAKQLTLVMYNEVGLEVMKEYLTKLPPEVQEMYQTQFKLNDDKKTRRGVADRTESSGS